MTAPGFRAGRGRVVMPALMRYDLDVSPPKLGLGLVQLRQRFRCRPLSTTHSHSAAATP